jgi:nicotinamide riboside kinase
MKIGVVGSFCTGKTTLARRLSDALGAAFIDESVRHYPENPDWARYTPEDYRRLQSWILLNDTRRELETELAKPPHIVIDAGPLCALAYSKPWFDEHGWRFWNAYVDHWLGQRPYDLIFKTAITEFPPKADGFRHVDPALRKTIDERVGENLRSRGLPFIQLPDQYDPALEAQYRTMLFAIDRDAHNRSLLPPGQGL